MYDWLQYETYVLFNGLSVDTDPILGDYIVWIEGGTANGDYTMTARSNGELLWVEEGVLNSDGETPRYTATVTEYTESDCSIDVYGKLGLSYKLPIKTEYGGRVFTRNE